MLAKEGVKVWFRPEEAPAAMWYPTQVLSGSVAESGTATGIWQFEDGGRLYLRYEDVADLYENSHRANDLVFPAFLISFIALGLVTLVAGRLLVNLTDPKSASDHTGPSW
ncbi:MAG: hypothetical protein HY329_22745 [Chloroflexi bacterium]|nr:hypothetical protein [Chloroflexota bacterium]